MNKKIIFLFIFLFLLFCTACKSEEEELTKFQKGIYQLAVEVGYEGTFEE